MLPRQLYELLPFFYILTGVVCAVLIDSTIVLISSMLLIVTGVFVLIMRRNFRKSLNQRFELRMAAAYESALDEGFEKRAGIDRRRRKLTEWPALDDSGDMIFSERRTVKRRVSAL